MLRVENLTVHYGPVRALDGVSLEVETGQMVALIGANGAGKSTTLKAICGIVPPSDGRILWNGEPCHRWPSHRLAKAGIMLVPEGRQLFPQMTVLENLEVGFYSNPERRSFPKRLAEVFDLFPMLVEKQNEPASLLSGGQQQMVALARGLMARPKLLMLDEPCLGLAPIVVQQLAEIIDRLHRSGLTILLVEQNAMLALELADRAYVLETGRVVIEGNAAALLGDERVQQAYLGF